MWKLLLFTFFAPLYAFYTSDSKVIRLKSSNFNDSVLNSKAIWIVKFYSPWCDNSAVLAPKYEKVAEALDGTIKVGAVNVDDYIDLAERYEILAYPGIKIFAADKSKPIDISGKRTARGLVNAAIKVVQEIAKKVLGEDLRRFEYIELNELKSFRKKVLKSVDEWLVLFLDSSGESKLEFNKAARLLKNQIHLAVFNASEYKADVIKYGVTVFPIIKHFAAGEKTARSMSHYSGSIDGDEIENWFVKSLNSVEPSEIKQIVDENSLQDNCNARVCVLAFLPSKCNQECRETHLKLLKDVSKRFKKNEWGWLWCQEDDQVPLEDMLNVEKYPSIAALNKNENKFVTMKKKFDEKNVIKFLSSLEPEKFEEIKVQSDVANDKPKVIANKKEEL